MAHWLDRFVGFLGISYFVMIAYEASPHLMDPKIGGVCKATAVTLEPFFTNWSAHTWAFHMFAFGLALLATAADAQIEKIVQCMRDRIFTKLPSWR